MYGVCRLSFINYKKMKKYLFVVVTMLMVSVVASAQFMNAGGSSSSSGVGSSFGGESAPSQFNTFSFSYHPMKMIAEYGKESDSESMNGFSFQWNTNKKVVQSVPLYVGYGVGVQYSFYKDEEDDDYFEVETATRFLSAKIPVDFLYRFDVPSTNVTILPYVGLDAVVHILGKITMTASYEDEEESESYSFFDKDDMGDDTYRRFNIDWHIGAKLMFNGKWFLGAAYEGQVLKLYSKNKSSIGFGQANLSVGLVF